MVVTFGDRLLLGAPVLRPSSSYKDKIEAYIGAFRVELIPRRAPARRYVCLFWGLPFPFDRLSPSDHTFYGECSLSVV